MPIISGWSLQQRWFVVGVLATVAAVVIYVGTMFLSGTAEGCSAYGGGREGSRTTMERTLFPPKLECRFVGPHGSERSRTVGWPAGGWIALAVLAGAAGAFVMSSRGEAHATD